MRPLSVLMSALLMASASFAFAQDEPAAEPPVEAEAPGPVVHNLKVDGSKSSFYAVTRKDGVGAALAHDHVIRATKVSGTIVFSADDASKNAISVTVDVPTMRVDAPADRKLAGLPEGPGADDQASIKENMLNEDQLNGAKFPTMTFKSTSITATGGDKYKVTGDLTIRGVTQSVNLPVTAKMEGGTFHGTGSLKITHTQFGFEPYSAAFGAIRNNNTITLTLDLYGG